MHMNRTIAIAILIANHAFFYSDTLLMPTHCRSCHINMVDLDLDQVDVLLRISFCFSKRRDQLILFFFPKCLAAPTRVSIRRGAPYDFPVAAVDRRFRHPSAFDGFALSRNAIDHGGATYCAANGKWPSTGVHPTSSGTPSPCLPLRSLVAS